MAFALGSVQPSKEMGEDFLFLFFPTSLLSCLITETDLFTGK